MTIRRRPWPLLGVPHAVWIDPPGFGMKQINLRSHIAGNRLLIKRCLHLQKRLEVSAFELASIEFSECLVTHSNRLCDRDMRMTERGRKHHLFCSLGIVNLARSAAPALSNSNMHQIPPKSRVARKIRNKPIRQPGWRQAKMAIYYRFQALLEVRQTKTVPTKAPPAEPVDDRWAVMPSSLTSQPNARTTSSTPSDPQ